MKISDTGLDLIKSFEGCKLTAYQDSVGVWTIGWGHTKGVYKGMIISQSQADKYLKDDMITYESNVNKYNGKYKFNQNQFDALVSFAYNVGSIDQLTANGTRTISQISDKFMSYNKAGGKVLAGLTRRRKAEKTLFDTPINSSKNIEGWVQDSKGWWYRYKDGTYPKSCWKKINGKDYYFKADGYMASDEYVKSANYDIIQKLYYVNQDGSWDNKAYRWMSDAKGWWLAKIGSNWYAKSTWANIDNKWYYFNDKGYMVTGTKTINGKIYSFRKDGSLVE